MTGFLVGGMTVVGIVCVAAFTMNRVMEVNWLFEEGLQPHKWETARSMARRRKWVAHPLTRPRRFQKSPPPAEYYWWAERWLGAGDELKEVGE